MKEIRKYRLIGGRAYLHYRDKGIEPNTADALALRYLRIYGKYPVSATDITWSNTDISDIVQHTMKKRKGNILFSE